MTAKDRPSKSETREAIAAECDDLKQFLLDKNLRYGDSALNPLRIFSKASPIEQILVRIDDKISRIVRGEEAGEDCYHDLEGYFALLRVAKKMQAAQDAKAAQDADSTTAEPPKD